VIYFSPAFFRTRWCFLDSLKNSGLSRFFGEPIAEMQKFPDFSAFVSVFLGFFVQMFRFTERMLGISNCFIDDLECFHHTISFHKNITA